MTSIGNVEASTYFGGNPKCASGKALTSIRHVLVRMADVKSPLAPLKSGGGRTSFLDTEDHCLG